MGNERYAADVTSARDLSIMQLALKLLFRASVSSMFSGPRSQFVLTLAALWAAGSLAAWPQTPRQNLPQNNAKPVLTRGQQTFESSCAGCHGLDGRGGERAPNIVERAHVQRLSDAQISRIIENGAPGTGMPSFHSLERSDVQAIVRYLRILQGSTKKLDLPGDPDRGEKVFFGQAGCSVCHMAAGKGGFIASDLSTYASTHTAEQIRSVIVGRSPGTNRQSRLVTATTRSGQKVVGRVRNEDNFSLQLQTLDGTFYSVTNSDLERLEYNSQALMPSDFSSTLSPNELNDLVSYLMRVAHARGGEAAARQGAFADE
jgi:cytochrome c oxidase cbb3-type subunit 3